MTGYHALFIFNEVIKDWSMLFPVIAKWIFIFHKNAFPGYIPRPAMA